MDAELREALEALQREVDRVGEERLAMALRRVRVAMGGER
jgi:hypothetical protein